ncbi:hypothetical protein CYMTET_34421 [Cymbomonas tetramitiformis]|uniref:Uncharacterized protein n=1 Tax=Cymbomonas tetramitiformis TaxID=36881 RepID=A0AAE0KQ75_9CHLO|nr:hypothetical protein CYMTET_34421 [Cymbomonas tetramitiformis]
MGEYRQYCQPVDTSMGGFHVGGATQGLALNTFTHTAAAATLYPANALHAHEPDLTFADKIVQLGGLSVTAEGRNIALNHVHVETDADDDEDGSDEDSAAEDGGAPPAEYSCPPARGRGKPPLGLGRSAAISSLVCALLCVRATATAFGGAIQVSV